MKLLIACLIILSLSGCIHLAVFSLIKDTATWWHYNERITKLEQTIP